MKRKLTFSVFLIVLLAILAACGGEDSDDNGGDGGDSGDSSAAAAATPQGNQPTCVEGDAEPVPVDFTAEDNSFSIQITGSTSGTVENSTRHRASTSGENGIEINMVDRFVGVGGTGIMLYIPADAQPGTYPITPHTTAAEGGCFTGTITITQEILKVQEGVVTIESIGEGKVTGSFDLIARDQVRQDREFEAIGVFNNIDLPASE